jgi:hypothetical protein
LPPERILDEFSTSTKRAIVALDVLTALGAGRVRLPVGELGIFPLNVFPAMYTFDLHTHLRHDIAPAIDRSVPATDDQRMTAVVRWLMALLAQSHRAQLDWMDASLSLSLAGPGGGDWRIEPATKGQLRVLRGGDDGTAAQITAQALEFPVWGTGRMQWRDCDVKLTGNSDIGERFLDTLNLV